MTCNLSSGRIEFICPPTLFYIPNNQTTLMLPAEIPSGLNDNHCLKYLTVVVF